MPSAPAVPNARDLRDLAVDVAIEAGQLLDTRLHDERRTVGSKSTATDMVTEMDRDSEQLIVDRLLAARPDDAVIGEEGADRAGTSGVSWIVDPLDGTTNYLYRLPGWNVSIGAEVDGEAVAGVVVIPGYGDVFSAAKGHGATWNGSALRAAPPPPLAETLLGTGFAYAADTRRRQAEIVTALLPRIRDIRRVGAAAADLCSVACGRLDAFAETGLARWDRCAGSVIAHESGIRVETLDTPLPGTMTIAAHPDLWDELVAALIDVGAIEPGS